MAHTTVHIESVRIHLNGDADLDRRRRVRLRVASRLEGIEWRPPQLPPSAILLVRRLEDPSPGGLGIEDPDPVPNPAWERAMNETLGELVTGADRPRSGRVRSDADVVLFRDEAEAWACWVRSVAGESQKAWWMRALRRTRPDSSGRGAEGGRIADTLGLVPRSVPAVVAYWTDWGIAGSMVRHMDTDAASHLLKTVCQAFGVTPPFGISGSPTGGGSDASGSEGSSRKQSSGRESGAGTRSGGRGDAPPPWTDLAGDASEEPVLEPIHRQWLGIMRTLARRPARLSAPFFRERWKKWIDRTGAPLPGEEPTARRGSASTGLDFEGNGFYEGEHRRRGDGAVDRTDLDHRENRKEREDTESAGRTRSERPSTAERIDPVGPTDGVRSDTGSSGGESERRRDGREARDGQVSGPESGVSSRDRTDEGRWSGSYTATELGGVWYLINAIERTIGEGVISIPDLDGEARPWGVLEALSREILQRAASGAYGGTVRHAEDPLWRLLARLDGRDPGKPVAEALPAFTEWAEGAVEPVRARLIEALGSGFSSSDAVASGHRERGSERSGRLTALLELPARIYHSRTHVDVLIPLEEVRLDVRRAGLDRDPGWLPAYGRVVALHFRE